MKKSLVVNRPIDAGGVWPFGSPQVSIKLPVGSMVPTQFVYRAHLRDGGQQASLRLGERQQGHPFCPHCAAGAVQFSLTAELAKSDGSRGGCKPAPFSSRGFLYGKRR